MTRKKRIEVPGDQGSAEPAAPTIETPTIETPTPTIDPAKPRSPLRYTQKQGSWVLTVDGWQYQPE